MGDKLLKHKQSGFIRKDIIAILIAGAALIGLLAYFGLKGEPVPFWPAVLVGLVNIIAAARLFLTVKKARAEAQAAARAQAKPGDGR